jgi:osmotically-inducible protein OsmY
MAGSTASALKTVRQVHNQIQVASTPTIYSRINDDWIATKITSKIANSRKVEVNRVKIIVANREVFIMGLLTETEAQQVTEIARSTTGVEKVVRAIEVVPEHQRAPL